MREPETEASPRRTATGGSSWPGPPTRSPPCCSATAPATGSSRTTCDGADDGAPRPRDHRAAGFDQPWRVAGRKIADARRRPSTSGCAPRRRPSRRRAPLVVGGRSAGARSAARCAREPRRRRVPRDLLPAAPTRSAGADAASTSWRAAGVPTLLVQGERDAMGRPEEFPELSDVRTVVVPWADHGMKVREGLGAHPRRVARDAGRRRRPTGSARSSGIASSGIPERRPAVPPRRARPDDPPRCSGRRAPPAAD